MRSKFRILIALLVIALLGVVAWILLSPHEPVYNGKKLSVWLDQYFTNVTVEANQVTLEGPSHNAALRQSARDVLNQNAAGTVPILAAMVSRAPDSFLRKASAAMTRKVAPSRALSQEEQEARGLAGFHALGTNGAAAVPALILLLQDYKSDNKRGIAASALGFIGPAATNAVPALIKSLQDTHRPVAYGSLKALRAVHGPADSTVPALIGVLNSTNNPGGASFARDFHYVAINTLGQYGAEAKGAVPSLLPYLQEKDSGVRLQATNALKAIDPAAAAKFGGQ